MRVIKFRAWSPGNKEMYFADDEYSFRVYGCGVNYQPHFENDELKTFYDNPCDGENKIEVMQFTGLKDGNGKEIYEGDILEYTYHRDRSGKDIKKFNDIVEWDEKDSYSGWAINKKMRHIVIGNIFQNPELLNT